MRGCFFALFVLGHFCACNGDSETSRVTPEDFDDLLEESRSCSPTDTCILSTGTGCHCPVPINQKRADEVADAAERVECTKHLTDCMGSSRSNPRCENGR